MTPTQQPLAPEHPHRADYCDEVEHAEVARILSELSAEHPARVAYATGARQVSDSISLSWLVADQHDMVQALTKRTWPHTIARLPGRGKLQAVTFAQPLLEIRRRALRAALISAVQ